MNAPITRLLVGLLGCFAGCDCHEVETLPPEGGQSGVGGGGWAAGAHGGEGGLGGSGGAPAPCEALITCAADEVCGYDPFLGCDAPPVCRPIERCGDGEGVSVGCRCTDNVWLYADCQQLVSEPSVWPIDGFCQPQK